MRKYNTLLWKQNLENLYNQALIEPPVKPFFLAVYNYMDYVLTTDTLAQLSDVFYVKKKTDIEEFEKFRKELIDYIQLTLPKLEKLKTDNNYVNQEIKRILSIRDGHITVLDDPEGWESIFAGFTQLRAEAYRDGIYFKELLDTLGIEEHNSERVTSWSAEKLREKMGTARSQLQRIRETRGWYAWEYLRLFYDMFNNYEGMKADTILNNKLVESMNLSLLIEELRAVLANKTYDQLQVFTYDKYKSFLHKAHRELLNEIANFDEISQLEEENTKTASPTNFIPFQLDDNTGVITVSGKEIPFKKDSRKYAFLKLLIKKPKGIYFGEAIAELEGIATDEIKEPKDIFYEACRGIQTSFSKIGITNFIEFNYNKANINPLYKKPKK